MEQSTLLELRGIGREYPAGDETLTVLDGLDLTIEAGEMVAIVGPSGSGKSTLMHLIGCLDQPNRGMYRVQGRDVGGMSPDDLATLRRDHFGFIFQHYHLLPSLDALANVEMPAIYAGRDRSGRRRRAAELLARLGMGERQSHHPGQLSGGQQQRVSIARALINGGKVILADEPTGALDRGSGEKVLEILHELNRQGHTVILVTHDQEVAAHAGRIIELREGRIVADRRVIPDERDQGGGGPTALANSASGWRDGDAVMDNAAKPKLPGRSWQPLIEALRMALIAMKSHRLRTLLTMLGIIIGIASVVSVVALGEGSRQKILKDINSMGTNTISIYPGQDFGDMRSEKVRTLVPEDGEALAGQPYIDTVTPVVGASKVVRYRAVSVDAEVSGVGEQYFRVRGMELASGRLFDRKSVDSSAQEVVIDENSRRTLFNDRTEVLGEVLLIGTVPCRVVGVLRKKDSNFGDADSLHLYVPYTTAMVRITGEHYLKNLTVRVADSVSTALAEQRIIGLLSVRHGGKDFFVSNLDTIRQTIEKTTRTMTLLISSIALISLVVGGIGVMNIMLVSVSERTAEIGVRLAVGAKRRDIRQQFLIEAVLVCLVGGVIGIALSLAIGLAARLSGSDYPMIYSATAIASAFACSTGIGVFFGFLPARNAARLNPVTALTRE